MKDVFNFGKFHPCATSHSLTSRLFCARVTSTIMSSPKENPQWGGMYFVRDLRFVAPNEAVTVVPSRDGGFFETRKQRLADFGEVNLAGVRDPGIPTAPRVGFTLEKGQLVTGDEEVLRASRKDIFVTGVYIEPGSTLPLVCEVRFDGVGKTFKTLMHSTIDKELEESYSVSDL